MWLQVIYTLGMSFFKDKDRNNSQIFKYSFNHNCNINKVLNVNCTHYFHLTGTTTLIALKAKSFERENKFCHLKFGNDQSRKSFSIINISLYVLYLSMYVLRQIFMSIMIFFILDNEKNVLMFSFCKCFNLNSHIQA
jgi:hypothetical protein